MLPNALNTNIAEIPKIEDQTYIRELLQLAVMDDLLGPAGGPNELIVDYGCTRPLPSWQNSPHVKQPKEDKSFLLMLKILKIKSQT